MTETCQQCVCVQCAYTIFVLRAVFLYFLVLCLDIRWKLLLWSFFSSIHAFHAFNMNSGLSTNLHFFIFSVYYDCYHYFDFCIALFNTYLTFNFILLTWRYMVSGIRKSRANCFDFVDMHTQSSVNASVLMFSYYCVASRWNLLEVKRKSDSDSVSYRRYFENPSVFFI